MLPLPKNVVLWHCSPPHAPHGRNEGQLTLIYASSEPTGVSLCFWLHMIDTAPTVLQWLIVGVVINMISFATHKFLVYLKMYVHVYNIQKYFNVFILSCKNLIYMYMNVV